MELLVDLTVWGQKCLIVVLIEEIFKVMGWGGGGNWSRSMVNIGI